MTSEYSSKMKCMQVVITAAVTVHEKWTITEWLTLGFIRLLKDKHMNNLYSALLETVATIMYSDILTHYEL